MELKRLDHPYLHELFKAVLLYEAPKVKKVLARKIHGKLMNEWVLVKPYQEITPTPEKERYRKAADIVWILKHPTRGELGYRRIIHEVKTGNCYVSDIVHVYKNLHFYAFKEEKGDSWQDEYFHSYAGTTNTPIYIWAWKKNRILPEDYETKRLIKRGAVRLLPLDWLLPVLEKGIEEVLK